MLPSAVHEVVGLEVRGIVVLARAGDNVGLDRTARQGRGCEHVQSERKGTLRLEQVRDQRGVAPLENNSIKSQTNRKILEW